MGRDIGAFAVAREAPAMIPAREPVAVDKAVLQAHAAVNAAVMPDMAFAAAIAPDDTFDTQKVHRLHVARI